MSHSVPHPQERTATDPTWRGPCVGYDRYGHPDHEYYACASCGVEVVDREHASHRPGCLHR